MIRVVIVDDEALIRDGLRAIAEAEPDIDVVDPAAHGSRLRAIRAMTVGVAGVRSKFKYGGNVDAPHRAAVAALLDGRNGRDDRAAAVHLRRRLGTTSA
ncbi:MAG: hypothetical protein NVSMB16_01560 [Acidimicrobiales bacterium]